MTPAVPASNQTVPLYAQVAFPVHLSKTFTYRLPQSIQHVAQVGARVVARLGTKPLTGYIVALLPRLRTGSSLIESEIKEVQELLDICPPLTAERLEYTSWLVDDSVRP